MYSQYQELGRESQLIASPRGSSVSRLGKGPQLSYWDRKEQQGRGTEQGRSTAANTRAHDPLTPHP
jgi:hypothetical protein